MIYLIWKRKCLLLKQQQGYSYDRSVISYYVFPFLDLLKWNKKNIFFSIIIELIYFFKEHVWTWILESTTKTIGFFTRSNRPEFIRFGSWMNRKRSSFEKEKWSSGFLYNSTHFYVPTSMALSGRDYQQRLPDKSLLLKWTSFSYFIKSPRQSTTCQHPNFHDSDPILITFHALVRQMARSYTIIIL